MDNQLAIRPQSLEEMVSLARMVHASKLAPNGFSTPEAILVAIQHGMEIGLAPMQALQSIAVIHGRPCVWGDAALAIVKAHPECEDVIETFERDTDEEKLLAKCEVRRTGKAPVIRTFSVAQARKANLWGNKGPWTQYPQRMLQMRARSWALRDSFPDALKGIGVSEEVRDTQPTEPPAKVRVILPGDDEPSPVITSLQLPDTQPELAEAAQ